MRYTINAISRTHRKDVIITSATSALDRIDVLIGEGFVIELVKDETGAEVSIPALVTAYMAENGIKRPVY